MGEVHETPNGEKTITRYAISIRCVVVAAPVVM